MGWSSAGTRLQRLLRVPRALPAPAARQELGSPTALLLWCEGRQGPCQGCRCLAVRLFLRELARPPLPALAGAAHAGSAPFSCLGFGPDQQGLESPSCQSRNRRANSERKWKPCGGTISNNLARPCSRSQSASSASTASNPLAMDDASSVRKAAGTCGSVCPGSLRTLSAQSGGREATSRFARTLPTAAAPAARGTTTMSEASAGRGGGAGGKQCKHCRALKNATRDIPRTRHIQAPSALRLPSGRAPAPHAAGPGGG